MPMNKLLCVLLLLCVTLCDAQVYRRAGRKTPVSAPAGWSTVATDNFNRTNADNLGANWTNMHVSNTPDIVSNQAVGYSSGGDHGAFWNANSFNTVQASEATFIGGSGVYAGVTVRASADSCYGFYGDTGDGCYLFKVLGDVWTQIGSAGSAFSANDVIRLEVDASGNLTAKVNGTTRLTAAAQTEIHNAGAAGLWFYQNGTVDNWKGEHQ